MAEINDLLPIDDNNVDRWPEGMPPSDVNNAGRADEGIMSRWHRDTNGSLVSTGTSTAYQLTTNQSLTAYYDGLEITYQAHLTCGDSPTLQLGALGAANIVTGDDIEVTSGNIVSGSKVNVIYNGSKWVLMNIPRASNLAFLDVANGFKASPQSVIISNDSATAGPSVILKRDRTTPAASDDLGAYLFDGVNGSASNVTWAELQARILDPVAATEDGSLVVRTIAGGAVADRAEFQKGLLIGAPTGGDPGDGSINVAGQVQSNGVEYQKGWTYISTVSVNSGNSVTLTSSIPSGINEINIFPRVVEQNTNNNRLVIRIGSGSIETTGYQSVGQDFSNTAQAASGYDNGFALTHNAQYDSGVFYSGTIFLNRINGNQWHLSSNGHNNTSIMFEGVGYKDLSGALDTVAITTSSGSANFQGSGTVDLRYR